MHHPTRTRLASGIRVVWVLGFLVGTASHVADIVSAGTGSYQGFPTPIRLFWVSLTVLDPIVIALVLLRRRTGVVLGVVIMVTDVAVNATVQAASGVLSPAGLIGQGAFLTIVLASARLLWRWFGETPRFPVSAQERGRGR
ncbi:hypothetical protein [Pseudactinotalea terrae]|uniref:hypothetical protein n=1 Tax=Pseudactinotalea terrae TaxID=1743262 RepID=UPI0012E25182|nr:hypothetical protein [Pseudactinotalea terrae]